MTFENTPDAASWDADDVRGLRAHLGVSQAEFADRIGTRQQTISEWETGASAPRRMSRRLLHLVAEASGYYTVGNDAVGNDADTSRNDDAGRGTSEDPA